MKEQQKIKVVIVDDEELAREDFKRLLQKFGNIELVGEAISLNDALEKCNTYKPDIVFLDIQLGNESGFDLIDHLDNTTKVIFVTAFDEYAIKAFEVSAHDYLLKPVTLERLQISIEKVTTDEPENAKHDKPLSIEDSIFLKLDTKYQFVKIDSIKFILAANDYSEVKIEGQNKGRLTGKSLREWEERLPENIFCRIHRSAIINTQFIESIEPWHNYSHRVYLKGELKPLLMSRRYFSIIKNTLG